MAYSDYGGFAYRNGQRAEERSDAVFSTEGLQSTPGSWPGWTIPEGRNGKSYHVILGDGPVHVCLYKQSSLTIKRNGDDVDLISACTVSDVPVQTYGEGRWLDTDHFKKTEERCSFEVDGHQIEVFWREEDNHYQYVRLTQPDGIVWTGFSGYGVGAGLEDGGHGYSTEDRESELRNLFS